MEESLTEETAMPTGALASHVDSTLIAARDSSLTGEQRNELYEKGKQFLTNKKLVNALDCFLNCINGLTPKSGFAYLPQCLRKISEIYYGMEDYNKAVKFLQVEKLYYETALVDSAGMQKLVADKGSPLIDDAVQPAGSEDPLIAKAHEYERLSQLCLKEDRPELALEFCGKATQLYQKKYGESHSTTLKALDSFTLIYAEVGKRQYSGRAESPTGLLTHTSGVGDEELFPDNKVAETRPQTEENSNSNFRVHEFESEIADRHSTVEQGPHPLVTGLCLIAGVWVVFVLGILAVLVMCDSTDAPGFCDDIRSKLRYWYLVASYYYNKQYRS